MYLSGVVDDDEAEVVAEVGLDKLGVGCAHLDELGHKGSAKERNL